MKQIVKALLALAMLGGVWVLGPPALANGLNITGTYALVGSPSTRLEVTAGKNRYTVLLAGGGQEAAGAAVSADCYIKARGKLQGDTLMADFVSMEADTFFYSKAQADKEKRKLKIVFHKNIAHITDADTTGYCGWGATFVGCYRRIAAQ